MMLSEKIIELRTLNQMSQGDLAEKLNVSRQSVSKWETGASIPDLDKLIVMSELFSISLDELVKGTQEIHLEKEISPSTNNHVTTSSSNNSQRIIGYIVFAVAFLVCILGLLTPVSHVLTFAISAYILACGLICIFAKKHAGRTILIMTLIILAFIVIIYLINSPANMTLETNVE